MTVLNTPTFLGYLNTNLVNDQFAYVVTDGYGGNATNIVYVNFTPFFTGQNGSLSVTNGVARLVFAGIPDFRYGIQRSTNITDWVTIWITNAPATGVFRYTDTFTNLSGAPPASAYYRLVWNP